MTPRIIEITKDNLEYPFESEYPQFRTQPVEAYARPVKVDPFPCYPHKIEVVREMAEHVERCFPVRFPPTYYLLHFDSPEKRSNAYTDREWVYDRNRDDWGGFEPWIVLAGKGTPIHPAVTRALVAHEYGHVVQMCIEYEMGCDRNESPSQFEREYMQLRGGNTAYGGGKWHTNVGELIADDFRCCIAVAELVHWPHEGFTHPKDMPEVQAFWREMHEKYAYRTEVVA